MDGLCAPSPLAAFKPASHAAAAVAQSSANVGNRSVGIKGGSCNYKANRTDAGHQVNVAAKGARCRRHW